MTQPIAGEPMNTQQVAENIMLKIEPLLKHGEHCLAGKYSNMGRCSCGSDTYLREHQALIKTHLDLVAKEAREQALQWVLDNKYDSDPRTGGAIRITYDFEQEIIRAQSTSPDMKGEK